jgi:hypothetical protein
VSRKLVWAVGFLAFLAAVALLIAETTRQEREARAKHEHEQALRYYEQLKKGEEKYPMINSPELMSMVANDPDCASKLTYIHFDMTDLNAPEYRQVQKLTNVAEISFYDCEGVETLLGYASSMPSVEKVAFPYARASDELVKRLAAIPSLKTLKITDCVQEEVDKFKIALPHLRFENSAE